MDAPWQRWRCLSEWGNTGVVRSFARGVAGTQSLRTGTFARVSFFRPQWGKASASHRLPAEAESRVATEKSKMESMVLFVHARRALVGLWPLMIKLWEATQDRFYKTNQEYKVLESLLCRCSPVRSIQSQADGAACRYADQHGNDLFKSVVMRCR